MSIIASCFPRCCLAEQSHSRLNSARRQPESTAKPEQRDGWPKNSDEIAPIRSGGGVTARPGLLGLGVRGSGQNRGPVQAATHATPHTYHVEINTGSPAPQPQPAERGQSRQSSQAPGRSPVRACHRPVLAARTDVPSLLHSETKRA